MKYNKKLAQLSDLIDKEIKTINKQINKLANKQKIMKITKQILTKYPNISELDMANKVLNELKQKH